MMKTFLSFYLKGSAVGLLVFWLILAIGDIAHLADTLDGTYNTPWYSIDWVRHPVTNIAMLISDKNEYWALNVENSELWHIREVNFWGKNFWTILQRLDMDPDGHVRL